MSGRQQLTLAVVICAAAAALALFAASRTWRIEVRPRPEPLPAVTTARSGGDLVPALPAMALVALAGAGGLVAARGRGRRVVGALLVGSGLGMATSAVAATATSGAAAGTVAVVWAAACGVSGAIVAGVGVVTLRQGRTWPGLGSSYEVARVDTGGPDMWDALDKRIDPTGDNTSRMTG
jgi:hypothetical protein